MLLAVAACSALSPRHLVVFRARSRHTYGFEPSASYDLPHLELSAAVDAPTLKFTEAEENLIWVDGITEEALERAARRSILTHGAFSIASTAPSVRGAVAALPAQAMLPAAEQMQIVDLAQPDLRKNARIELQAELSASFLECGVGGPPRVPAIGLRVREPKQRVVVQQRRLARPARFRRVVAEGTVDGAVRTRPRHVAQELG